LDDPGRGRRAQLYRPGSRSGAV